MTNILLILTSSILFFLSHPNFIFQDGLGFLIFVAYAPIFILCRKESAKKCFLYGVLWAVLSYGLFGYWLFTYSLFLFFVTVAWFSVFYGASFCAMSKVKFPPIQVLIFVFFEFLKTKGDFGFSYGTAVYATWKIEPLLKLVTFVGIWGIEALILAENALVAHLLLNRKILLEHKKLTGNVMVAVYFIAAFFSCGVFLIFFEKNETSEKTTTIALVQNNSDPWIYDIDYYEKDILEMERLTKEAIEKNPEIEIVVFPETAFVPSIIKNFHNPIDEKRGNIVRQFLDFMDAYENVTFVVGNGNDGYNSSLVFTGKKNCIPPEPEIYNKNHLVPLSEFLPWYFKFLESVMEKLNVSLWKKGEGVTVFDTGKIKFSTPICFEDTFPPVCKKMKKAGSELFVTITNDAWSKSRPCQKQHLSMAVFRSAENRIPTVRATVSGATCLIDKNGRVVSELEHFEKGVLVVDVEF